MAQQTRLVHPQAMESFAVENNARRRDHCCRNCHFYHIGKSWQGGVGFVHH